MEIGSEFWLDENQYLEAKREIPIWLNNFGNVVLTSSGRGAISLVLNQINPVLRRAMLPSYVCESIIIPFEKAGYELIYYEVDQDFKPQLEGLEETEIGVFLHMGYFGFPTNNIVGDIVSFLKRKKVIVIEDVTHTLFSDFPRNIENDFVVGSIRKWFGVPSGGFLASRNTYDVEQTILNSIHAPFVKLRTDALTKKSDYFKTLNPQLKVEYLQKLSEAEMLLDDNWDVYRIDRDSETIIKNINNKEIYDKRRENYKFLLENLPVHPNLKIIFNDLDGTFCPMFFPVYIFEGRDELRSSLASKQIYCPIHWPVPNQLEKNIKGETRSIYNTIMSIPCDQRYSIKDMSRIVEAIKEII